MKNLSLSFLLFLVIIQSVAQESTLLSSNTVFLNPAHIGNSDKIVLRYNRRFERYENTNRGSLEFFIRKINTNIALLYQDIYFKRYSDKFKNINVLDIKYTHANSYSIIIAPKLTKKDKYTISPAIGISYNTHTLNSSELYSLERPCPYCYRELLILPNDSSFSTINYQVGIKLNNTKSHLGIAYTTSIIENQSTYNQFILETSYLFRSDKKLKIHPYLMFIGTNDFSTAHLQLQTTFIVEKLSIITRIFEKDLSLGVAYKLQNLKLSLLYKRVQNPLDFVSAENINQFEIGLKYAFTNPFKNM